MATRGIGRPLTILLQADTTGFAKGLQEAQTGVQKMSKSINKAAQVASVALGGLTVVAVQFAKAAAEDQKSTVLLEKSLQDLILNKILKIILLLLMNMMYKTVIHQKL